MPDCPGGAPRYVRNGTTNLYAPLDVAPGTVITDMSRGTTPRSSATLNLIDNLGAGAAGRDVALDRSSTHKTPIDPALAGAPPASRCTSPCLQLVAEPSRAVVCALDREVDQTRRPSLDQRPGRLDPHLDQQPEQEPQAIVWHKAADKILASLAAFVNELLIQDAS